MVALLALATLRKWENSFWLSSPAPSHENTTNCGGFWPGFSLSGRGRCGWAPVYAVEPSPIRRIALFGAGATGFCFCFCGPGAACPSGSEPIAHPASDATQTAAIAVPAAILRGTADLPGGVGLRGVADLADVAIAR
ncbi:hypothetical protein GCM10010378_65440 [Streptomyces viridochromogenes]